MLRLERGALERKLQDMLQATLTRPLQFDLAAGGTGAGAALLLPTFEYLCRLGAQPASARPQRPSVPTSPRG